MGREVYSLSLMPEPKGPAGEYHKGGGCWVSNCKCFLLVLLALLLALTVGLLVYYYAPRHGDSGQSQGTDGTDGSGVDGASTAPPSTSAPERPSYRLPTNLVPILYEIQLRPYIYSGDPSTFYFSASYQATFKCLSPTDKILFHTNLLTIDSSSVYLEKLYGNGSVAGEVGTGEMQWEELRQFLTIPVDETLETGWQYRLRMDYNGTILPDLFGLYYSTYNDGSQTKHFVTSQLQPTSARKVFPCWDEPGFKAQYDIAIDRKPPFTSISNGEIIRMVQMSGGWVRDYYSRSPYMSSYLVAVIVSEFGCVDSPTATGTKVQVCSRPAVISQTDLAQQATIRIQEYFEDLFNISYPLPKMTHAAVPDFGAGAMENWGLAIYREALLLYESGTTSVNDQIYIVIVLAHEISHMWFGNLVTMEWWNDIWLNEGFATYMESLGTEAAYPDWDMEADQLVWQIHYVMLSDALASSRPVRKAAETTPEIISLFDFIAYYKGAAVIRMMRNFLGEETFRWGISKYLRENSYGIGSSVSLFRFLTQEARLNGLDVDVEAVMQTWLEQLGYPVVTYNLDLQTRKITVSQKHFLIDPNSADLLPESEFGYKWKVPISYVTNRDTDLDNWQHYKYWLDGTSAELEGEVPQGTAWILGNVKERFYYRVNYNEENWDALVDTLITDHTRIDVTNRAQLLDDSFNLGRAGILNQTRFMDLTKYMSAETNYFPWHVALSAFGYFNGLFGNTPNYGIFRAYMRSILEGPYNRLGWTDSSSSPNPQEKQLRGDIIRMACYYGLPDCLEKVVPLFQQWINSDPSNNPIDPDLRRGVYCAGIAVGDETAWEAAFARMKIESTATEVENILRALGCTQKHWLLLRYLQAALTGDGIRRQDMFRAILAVGTNNLGRFLVWQFMMTNWDAVLEREPISIARYITISTRGFSSEYQYNQIQSFMNSRDDLGANVPALNQALETVRANIEWRAANEETFIRWLKAATP